MDNKTVNKPKKTPVGYMFDGTLESITKSEGTTYITLKTNASVNNDILDLYGQQVECAVKKIKAKRSSNANNYCWELCAQIGAAVQLGSIDIYKEAVRHRGIYKDYEIPEENIVDVEKVWNEFGIGWFTDKVDNAPDNKVILRCYYGTSSYNTAQMANIINYLTEEADNLGLTTLSEHKKKELLKNWDIKNKPHP